jgi:dienelactone hydrolase
MILLLLALQAEPVEKALLEEDGTKRAALLRGLDVAAVEKALRSPVYGPPRGGPTDFALHVPAGYDPSKPWPLLVTLHGHNPEGRASAGADWIRTWLRSAAADYLIVAPTTTRHTWGSRPGHEIVLAAVGETLRRYHVDPDRVYLDGMSMGGGGAFRLAEHHPDRWAAIAPRCNVPDVRMKQDRTYVAMVPENLRNVPVYWVVGAKDPLIPLAAAHAARDAYAALKYDVVYREHSEGGHDWSIEKDADVLAWFATKRRTPYPEEVVWKSYEQSFTRSHWIEVLKRKDAPPLVTVHLDMKNQESERRTEYRPPVLVRAKRSGQTIEVVCEEVRELRVWLSDAMMDLDRPVVVTLNGRKVHDAVVKRSVETLVDEARRRGDRSMIFSACVDLKPR